MSDQPKNQPVEHNVLLYTAGIFALVGGIAIVAVLILTSHAPLLPMIGGLVFTVFVVFGLQELAIRRHGRRYQRNREFSEDVQ